MSGTRGVNVKRISSQEYEDRLNDIMTAVYYDQMLPEYEPEPIKETYSGSHMVCTDAEVDGWANLAAAIISQSLLDWFDLWLVAKKQDGPYLSPEKRNMREIEQALMQNPVGEAALLRMMMEVRRIENDGWEIERMRRRLMRGAHPTGWKAAMA